MEPSFVDADGRTVHIWREGGGPPVVLLHGFGDDGACWGAVTGTFTATGRSVVAPDAPAHGRTPLLDGEAFTAERRAGDTVAVMSALGIEQAVLVGHSMGALTALLLAAEHPELAAGVVLEDPPLPDGPFGAVADSTNPLEPWIEDVQRLDEDSLRARCCAENPRWSDAEIEPWAPSKLALDRRVFSAPHTWLGRAWRDALEQVRCPLVLLTGELSLGAAVGSEARAWFRDTGRHLVEAAGAGHNVRRERRDAFDAAVRSILGE